MMMIRNALFWLARSRLSAVFIGFAFTYLTPLMPLTRRFESKDLLVFAHPRPSWQKHWLAVPKRACRDIRSLDSKQENAWAWADSLLQAVQAVEEIDLVVLNGGSFQDVPQLHFHLAGEARSVMTEIPQPLSIGDLPPGSLRTLGSARGVADDQTDAQTWWLLFSETAVSPLRLLDRDSLNILIAIRHLFHLIQEILTENNPTAYRLFIPIDQNRLMFYLMLQH